MILFSCEVGVTRVEMGLLQNSRYSSQDSELILSKGSTDISGNKEIIRYVWSITAKGECTQSLRICSIELTCRDGELSPKNPEPRPHQLGYKYNSQAFPSNGIDF